MEAVRTTERARARQVMPRDIQILRRRHAVQALLVAAGHQANCKVSVDAILETNGQRHMLRLVLGKIMKWDRKTLLPLVRAFRQLFSVEVSRLSWSWLYMVLRDFVKRADIRHYFAIASHRLHNAVREVSQPVIVPFEPVRRPFAERPRMELVLQ